MDWAKAAASIRNAADVRTRAFTPFDLGRESSIRLPSNHRTLCGILPCSGNNTSSRSGAVLTFDLGAVVIDHPSTRWHRGRTLKTGLWLYVRRKTGYGTGPMTTR